MAHKMEKEKTDILLSALEERYKSVHAIRDRVESIGLWALGLMLAAGGWFIIHGINSCTQKVLYALALSAAFGALRFRYLRDLEGGFRNQLRIAVRIEKALGLFTPKFFDEQDEPIYPKSFEKAGTDHASGRFFQSTHILLYIGFFFLIASILFSNNSGDAQKIGDGSVLRPFEFYEYQQ